MTNYNQYKCAFCGKEYRGRQEAEYGGVSLTQRCCSDECSTRAYYRYKKELAIEQYHILREELIRRGVLPHSYTRHLSSIRAQQYDGYHRMIKKKACVWISGKTGRGKSCLARLVLQWHMYFKKQNCGCETALALFNEGKRWEQFVHIPVLVIEDIDKAAYGEYTGGLLHNMLTHRENMRLRTIITSEYDIRSVAQKISTKTNGMYGQSTFARLDCRGKRMDIHIEGDNLRTAESEAKEDNPF